MADERARIALHETVTRQLVYRAAWDNNWDFHDTVERSEDAPAELIFVTRDKTTFVHFVEDFFIGLNYLVVRGPRAAEVAKQAHETMRTYRPEEALKAARQGLAGEGADRAVFLAAAAAPARFDPKFFKLFEEAAAHEDPEVRGAAVVSAGYAGWAEFRPLLERLKKSDPDERVREDASMMLESLAPDWGEA
jgi:HEAT repeat protein